ncbi:hypothetical protein AALP_AA8G333800 [Arabis alpina]|uniref:GBF-interacting protein 1 N-terminal domain-containing protein n=1 Tax=Arabis alpina TaxID=50452 RepID=A0A087GB45_ARAAL|nr:hypothetical protein AALP_AA8G333800 [Arabis alpina]
MVIGSKTGVNRVMGPDDEAKKMIESIKEILGNHSDAAIYTALREAKMNADDAVQKLILQDTFHEGKNKKDKQKEIDSSSSKKSVDNVEDDPEELLTPASTWKRKEAPAGATSQPPKPKRVFNTRHWL